MKRLLEIVPFKTINDFSLGGLRFIKIMKFVIIHEKRLSINLNIKLYITLPKP